MLNLKRKNGHLIESGMVFNVAVYFKKLVSSKDVKYSFMVADTIQVTDTGSINLTKDSPVDFDEISYSLGDDEEAGSAVSDVDEGEQVQVAKPKKKLIEEDKEDEEVNVNYSIPRTSAPPPPSLSQFSYPR